jgi:thiamine-phosphate pyrophosphorylase
MNDAHTRLCLHAIVSDVDVARTAVDEGATVIQLRLKGASTEEVIERGRLFRPLAAMFVVNDDVEAALMLSADGVHLGREDAGAERALAAGLRLGRSARTPAEAQAAQRLGAHYIGCGPVWPTPTKAHAAIGIARLALVCSAVTIPVIAIGGIDPSNAASCIIAGAAGVAVVRAVSETRLLRAAVDAALAQLG